MQNDSRNAVGRNDSRSWGNQPRQYNGGRQYQPQPLVQQGRPDGRGWNDGRRQGQGQGYRSDGYGRGDGYGNAPDGWNGGYRDDGYRQGGDRRDGGYRGRRDDREPVTCHVLDYIGIIGENRERNTTRELRRVSWNGRQPKLDLRDWGHGEDGGERCFKGITLHEDEALRLRDALVSYFSAGASDGDAQAQAQGQAPAPQGASGQDGAAPVPEDIPF